MLDISFNPDLLSYAHYKSNRGKKVYKNKHLKLKFLQFIADL